MNALKMKVKTENISAKNIIRIFDSPLACGQYDIA